MNKKQLVVVWVLGTVLSAIILLVPKIAYYDNSYVIPSNLNSSTAEKLASMVNWSLIFSYCMPALIGSCLLIYTFRSKR
jgi:hypothetical protein